MVPFREALKCTQLQTFRGGSNFNFNCCKMGFNKEATVSSSILFCNLIDDAIKKEGKIDSLISVLWKISFNLGLLREEL